MSLKLVPFVKYGKGSMRGPNRVSLTLFPLEKKRMKNVEEL